MIKNIFITDYQTATSDIFFLRNNGITKIISLLPEPLKEKTERYHERFHKDFSIESHRFYFEDTEAINQPDAPNEFHIRQIINLIKAAHSGEKEHVLLCHCLAGIGRSTAVAFIARRLMGDSNEVALDWLLNHRPRAYPNLLILEFADAILGKLNGEDYMADVIYEWKKGTKSGKLVYIEKSKLKEYES